MTTPDDLLPGQYVGPYCLLKRLTRGTFGTFFIADNGREKVVLKALPGRRQLGTDLFVLNERLRTLDHPAIAKIIDIDLQHTHPYVVTPFIPCVTTLTDSGTLALLSKTQKLGIIRSVGSALVYLHEQQIVHAGLQPACVLLDSERNVHLSGFDLAVAHPYRSCYVRAADYSAPEQELGMVDERSDQFALGRIAYEVLIGDPPSQQSQAYLARLIYQSKLTASTGRALLTALADDPKLRWVSVQAFLDALFSDSEKQ